MSEYSVNSRFNPLREIKCLVSLLSSFLFKKSEVLLYKTCLMFLTVKIYKLLGISGPAFTKSIIKDLTPPIRLIPIKES
jgi:hypothetical protein